MFKLFLIINKAKSKHTAFYPFKRYWNFPCVWTDAKKKKSPYSKERFDYHQQKMFHPDADSAQNRLFCAPVSHFNHNSEKYDCRQCWPKSLFP